MKNEEFALSLSADARARWAEGVLRRVFRDCPADLAVRLWDGRTLAFGRGVPECTFVFRTPGIFRELLLSRDPLRLAEAYFLGRMDVEGDLYAALRLKDYLSTLRLSATEKAGFLFGALRLPKTADGAAATIGAPRSRLSRRLRRARAHSKARDRQVIAFHYDVSNEFYRLWLDEQLSTPVPTSRTRTTTWTGRSRTSWSTSAASCGSDPANGCSTSAAAGAR